MAPGPMVGVDAAARGVVARSLPSVDVASVNAAVGSLPKLKAAHDGNLDMGIGSYLLVQHLAHQGLIRPTSKSSRLSVPVSPELRRSHNV